MHSTKSRFVIGPSNILFGGVYVCTFQPGYFTGWVSEGVNDKTEALRMRSNSTGFPDAQPTSFRLGSTKISFTTQ